MLSEEVELGSLHNIKKCLNIYELIKIQNFLPKLLKLDVHIPNGLQC